MTKKILITDLKEVNGLKVVCKCGAYWSISSDMSELPKKCIKCDTLMPTKEMWKVCNDIKLLNKNCEDQNITILIETEEKNL